MRKNIPTPKLFSSHPGPLVEQPFLAKTHADSWEWLVKKGLRELFDEISPIKDYSGNEIELYFLDYYFDEPRYTEEIARQKGLTYEAPLRVKVKLVNNSVKETKEQEVYLGDFPIMTSRYTFLINGVERVMVSQLIRSSGVYFTGNPFRGKMLFGAKVIPNRGSWLEFETESDGFIGVKVDRHRKAPVTELLRIFETDGKKLLDTNEKILDAFRDIDNGPIKFIEATLKKDSAKTSVESYVEIYKRLRPGDLATPDNAQNLIDGMFKRTDRYSLSNVGRFKVNQRLGLDRKKDSNLFDLEDLISIIKEIITLNNNPEAEADDIDHLGNRRIKSVGELLQMRLYVGFARMRRAIQDKISTSDPSEVLSPVQLINGRPLVAVMREFLSSSQLSQFMDQTNPLAETEHKRRLSLLGPGGLTREHAGFEVRDVHPSHYGRICPIETPEGQTIGLVNHLASFAKVNELGFLETPYAKVKNGKITNEITWFDAIDETKYKIAHGGVRIDKDGKIVDDIVEARINGEPRICDRDEVDYIDVTNTQLVSVATALIPFLEYDDAKRALMGSNMQRQAVPPIKPQVPLVGTGMEEKVAQDSLRALIAPADGEVIEVDANHLTLKTKDQLLEFEFPRFQRSNKYTNIYQKPIVDKGDKVKKGDILADGPSMQNGVLALGQNLTVAFMSWEGANFEDAIILSERIVQNDIFSSIQIKDFYCDVRDTKLGPEVTTNDIPNVSEEKLRNLDEEGIIRIGAEVGSGDILVGKVSPKGETELTAEEKLLRAIFEEKARDVKDTSLEMPHGESGRVIGVKIFSRDRGDKLEPGVIKKIQIEVAKLRKIRAGDKLSGRHGNKGVISQIRPVEDMPYLEDGTPVDIILNPLGVTSRMNLGQTLETHLGLAAKKLGYRAVTPVFVGANEGMIREELKKAGYPESGKLDVYDGRTGKKLPQPVTVGVIYMIKLDHMVEDKIHMRATGPYSLITQQPLGGKAQFGGQRFGEMEVWALEGYGAAVALQEMLTVKSDDVFGRAATYESIIRGEKIKSPNVPAAFNVLVNELKALGLDVNTLNDENTPNKE